MRLWQSQKVVVKILAVLIHVGDHLFFKFRTNVDLQYLLDKVQSGFRIEGIVDCQAIVANILLVKAVPGVGLRRDPGLIFNPLHLLDEAGDQSLERFNVLLRLVIFELLHV